MNDPARKKRLDDLFNANVRVSTALASSLSISGTLHQNSLEYSTDRRRSTSSLSNTALNAAQSSRGTSVPPSSSSSSSSSSSPLLSSSVKTMTDAYIRSKTLAVTRNSGFLIEQDIDALSAQTGYSRKELYGKFVQFKALSALSKSPLGVDRQVFRAHIPVLAIEDESFANRVFDLLDVDCTGYLDWEKFLTALSALDRGSRALRMEFIFKCADKSGTGVLTRDQLYEFIATALRRTAISSFETARGGGGGGGGGEGDASGGGGGGGGVTVAPGDVKNEDDLVRDFSYRFFNEIDIKGEGTITLAQTLQHVARHSEIDDVTSIFGRAMLTGTRTEIPNLLLESQKLKQEEIAKLASTLPRK